MAASRSVCICMLCRLGSHSARSTWWPGMATTHPASTPSQSSAPSTRLRSTTPTPPSSPCSPAPRPSQVPPCYCGLPRPGRAGCLSSVSEVRFRALVGTVSGSRGHHGRHSTQLPAQPAPDGAISTEPSCLVAALVACLCRLWAVCSFSLTCTMRRCARQGPAQAAVWEKRNASM